MRADPKNAEVVRDEENGTTDGAEKKGNSNLASISTTTRPPVRNSANRAW